VTLPRPGPLFNLLTSPEPLSPVAQLAGPGGLLLFVPLVPVLLLAARRAPRAALIFTGVAWLLATLRPVGTAVVLGWVGLATVYVLLLAALRKHEVLGRRGMIGAVWGGLHVLVFPFWWSAGQWWYTPLSPMAAMHNVGLAYFLFRFIAWGVSLADSPAQPLRFVDTVCWILYPPSMRIAPFLLRDEFLARLDAWDPRRSPEWRAGLRRFVLCVVGAICYAVLDHNRPKLDFFGMPEKYLTGELLALFYLVPLQVYLMLWTYNQLALTVSLWIGLPVPDNFDRLPLATSVREFWRRWNLTVGAWLRNYVYIPLGGNRRHVAVNYVVTFAYCGLWHGAAWSFLLWGLTQGAALTVQRWWDLLRNRQDATTEPPRHREDEPPRRKDAKKTKVLIWAFFCWLLTMHYQAATIFVFVDFEHFGVRFFRELIGRFL
jgi:D-alanyl-lipoteichoic acid acyltransferase DltB (MBOAT superfamily)